MTETLIEELRAATVSKNLSFETKEALEYMLDELRELQDKLERAQTLDEIAEIGERVDIIIHAMRFTIKRNCGKMVQD